MGLRKCNPASTSAFPWRHRQQYSTVAARKLLRPSIAPKPAIDIKHIRQNPELYAQNCIDRNYENLSNHPLRIVKLFDEWKLLQNNGRSIRERSNSLQAQLSRAKALDGHESTDTSTIPDQQDILHEARQLKQLIGEIESQEGDLDSEIVELAMELPNLTCTHSPIGSEPLVIGSINEPPLAGPHFSNRTWRDHVDIGSRLDILDFAAATVTSGWGWYYLKNEAALLEQALVHFALSVAMEHGFAAVSPPSMVYSHISDACGFQPRDRGREQQVYCVEQSHNDRMKGRPTLSLAGTAEIPFASMKANTILEEADLPFRIVGTSRCYRAEAGGRGVDSKGLYRVHEFTKVEMFGWTLPNGSENSLFETMVSVQTHILKSLGLHCRILEQPSADLGASAARKQDIEAFFPSRHEKDNGWGEVTSTSICTDYQTRRLGTRVRNIAGGNLSFPYTVNGTALAVPRVLAAILENGWDEGQMCVRVPESLWPWMHGIQTIREKH